MTTLRDNAPEYVQNLLNELAVPAEFGDANPETELELIAQLDAWKTKAQTALTDLRTRLTARNDALSLDEQTRIVSTVAQYDGQGPWVMHESREVARGTSGSRVPRVAFGLLTHRVRDTSPVRGGGLCSTRTHLEPQYSSHFPEESAPGC